MGGAKRYDAVVVGSGPNGLTAAILLARAGRSVLVIEASEIAGGGCRTEEITLPGFLHDSCSAIHPMCVISPVFREVGLLEQIDLVYSPAEIAHPLPNGDAAILERSIAATGENLGRDREAWRR